MIGLNFRRVAEAISRPRGAQARPENAVRNYLRPASSDGEAPAYQCCSLSENDRFKNVLPLTPLLNGRPRASHRKKADTGAAGNHPTTPAAPNVDQESDFPAESCG